MPRSESLPIRLRRDWHFAIRLDRESWIDLLRAARELAIARVRLRSWQARDDLGKTVAAESQAQNLDSVRARLVERIAFAIPRAAKRLPLRSDCLVQALAAKRWLSCHDVESRLVLGVRKRGPTNFEAHAWLMVGDRVVTGGDISTYVPLGAESPSSPPLPMSG